MKVTFEDQDLFVFETENPVPLRMVVYKEALLRDYQNIGCFFRKDGRISKIKNPGPYVSCVLAALWKHSAEWKREPSAYVRINEHYVATIQHIPDLCAFYKRYPEDFDGSLFGVVKYFGDFRDDYLAATIKRLKKKISRKAS